MGVRHGVGHAAQGQAGVSVGVGGRQLGVGKQAHIFLLGSGAPAPCTIFECHHFFAAVFSFKRHCDLALRSELQDKLQPVRSQRPVCASPQDRGRGSCLNLLDPLNAKSSAAIAHAQL